MNHRKAVSDLDLADFIADLNQDATPKFQCDYSGRIWKRGNHRHDWAIHEEEQVDANR